MQVYTASTVNMKVEQVDVRTETKTKDNVRIDSSTPSLHPSKNRFTPENMRPWHPSSAVCVAVCHFNVSSPSLLFSLLLTHFLCFSSLHLRLLLFLSVNPTGKQDFLSASTLVRKRNSQLLSSGRNLFLRHDFLRWSTKQCPDTIDACLFRHKVQLETDNFAYS